MPRVSDYAFRDNAWYQHALALSPPSRSPLTLWCLHETLTIDSQGHLSLPSSYPGHHSPAHVLPGILLADRFEGQGLLIAQDLGGGGESDTKIKGRLPLPGVAG